MGEVNLGAKRKWISQGFLVAVLFYAGLISVLYVRMKQAEQKALEYTSARSCTLPSNCREIVKAEIVDYVFRKVRFRNYGSKGIPLQSGSFQKYVFVLSLSPSENRTTSVLPGVPLSAVDFDLANVYLPVRSDEKLSTGELFKGQWANVEIWQDTITYILVTVYENEGIQPGEVSTNSDTTIGPLNVPTREIALPTEDHPTIVMKQAKDDFNGWTIGIVFPAALFTVVAGIVSGIVYIQNRPSRKQGK